MLGHSHAMSGLAAGAATLPWAPVTTVPEQLAWVAAWGGFALLPDLDQGGLHWRGVMPEATGSTVARMWGPFTTTLAALVHRIALGHRMGTHDLLVAPVVFWLLTDLATLNRWSLLAIVALGIGLALQALHVVIPGKVETTVLGNLALSFGASWYLTQMTHQSMAWLPWAVAGGVVTHILGDWLTTDGIPLPLTWAAGHGARLSAGLFTTGERVERVFAGAFVVATVVLMAMRTPLEGYVAPILAAGH